MFSLSVSEPFWQLGNCDLQLVGGGNLREEVNLKDTLDLIGCGLLTCRLVLQVRLSGLTSEL